MTQNKLCYNYGILQGRLESLKTICDNDDTFLRKDLVLSIINLPIEPIIEEEDDF